MVEPNQRIAECGRSTWPVLSYAVSYFAPRIGVQMMRQCSRLTTAMLAMGFIGLATISQAATTITAVKVTIGPQTPNPDPSATTTYCSIGAPATPGPSCDVSLWNLAGVTLTPGDKLILTQTGTLGPNEPNFDTSDRFKPGSFLICATATPCTTRIWVDSG